MYHLRSSQIVDIAEGRAAPDEAAHSHLASCATCSGDLAWLTQVISLMRDADAAAPPADAVARVKALFRQRRPAPAASRIILAMLHSDSARTAPAFGLRAGPSLERQLLLCADSYDIDLRIAPVGERWNLSGQIFGYSGPSGNAELLGAVELVSAEVNDLCEFMLPPVRAGRYNLILSLGDCAITVPGLELGTYYGTSSPRGAVG
ncbi:MAG: hypothetical protein WCI67_11870 [Chloroflexales bacterium]